MPPAWNLCRCRRKAHLIRNTFRYASKKYWGQIAVDLKPIYLAPSRKAAWAAFEEFEEKWAKPYPAIGQLWRNAWEQFVPVLDYDAEIRASTWSPGRWTQGHRADKMDHALEAGPQRVRNHLRRPHAQGRDH